MNPLMNPFQVMARQLFQNPHLVKDFRAIYTTVAGTRCEVAVIEALQGEIGGVLITDTRQPAKTYHLLAEEVQERPRNGDTLIVGDETFLIRAAEPDGLGHTWLLDVEPL